MVLNSQLRLNFVVLLMLESKEHWLHQLSTLKLSMIDHHEFPQLEHHKFDYSKNVFQEDQFFTNRFIRFQKQKLILLSMRHKSLAASWNCVLKSERPVSSDWFSFVFNRFSSFLCNHSHSSLNHQNKFVSLNNFRLNYLETLAIDRIFVQGNEPGMYRLTITRTQSTLFCILR